MKDTVIFYHQYYLGHMSFAIAKDMSWFTVDVMAIVNHYNNRCDKSTISSKFDMGNIKCMQELGYYPMLQNPNFLNWRMNAISQ